MLPDPGRVRGGHRVANTEDDSVRRLLLVSTGFSVGRICVGIRDVCAGYLPAGGSTRGIVASTQVSSSVKVPAKQLSNGPIVEV